MKKFLLTYSQSLLLLFGILAGGLIGSFCPSIVPYIKPLGAIFLNMIFVLVVPLIFLSMYRSIVHLGQQNSVGKVLGRILLVFLGMATLSAILSYIGIRIYSPMESFALPEYESAAQDTQTNQMLVDILSVSNLYMLLDKGHLLPLILIAILAGIASAQAGERANAVIEFNESLYSVVMRLFEIIMIAAPIGLGCYFADVMSQMGGDLLKGYARSMVIYMILLAILYLIIDPLLVLLFGGKHTLSAYVKSLVGPSITAVSTCSSSACIPMSISTLTAHGVNENVAETVIPLGTNIFKQGSVPEGCIKVLMAMSIAGLATDGFSAGIKIIVLGILASCLVTAVASGGMTSEAIICAILGVNPQIVGILVVFAALIDMPATLLNTTGNVTAAWLVDCFGKRKKKSEKIESSINDANCCSAQ